MAQRLEFESTLDASGYKRGLSEIESASKQSAQRMERAMYQRRIATVGGFRAANEEALFAPGRGFTYGGKGPLEQQGRGIRRNAGAAAQLLHVGRATVDSLASGQDPVRVIMQQAPQAAQAVLQIFENIKLWHVAVAAVAAIIAYKVVSGLANAVFHTKELAEGAAGVEYQMARLANKLKEVAQARQLAFSEEADKLKRGKSAMDYDISAADAAADLEKARLRQKYLAEKAVHTKKEELELEKQLLSIDERRAFFKMEAAKKKQAEAIGVAEAQARLEKVKIDFDKAIADQAAELEKAKASHPVEAGIFGSPYDPEKSGKRQVAIANAMAIAERENADFRAKLRAAEADLAEAKRRNGQGEIDAAQARLIELQNEINKPEEIQKRHVNNGMNTGDSLINVGNFLGSARGKIESLAQKQADLMQRYLPMIEANTRSNGGGAAYPPT